ncbi:MAG: hypothetical protein ACJAS1_004524 [Oleiphilaceae bacterium]|jgi:hypothetical protein
MISFVSETQASYQALSLVHDGKPLLSVELPLLNFAGLLVKTTRLNPQEVISKLSDFKASQGWTLYRDRLDVNPAAPSEVYFTEGEWCKGNGSIHLKLISDDIYLLTEYQLDSDKKDSMECYQDQQVFVRKYNKEQVLEKACYRLWWQCDAQGKWQPLVQQFLGFNSTKEASK